MQIFGNKRRKVATAVQNGRFKMKHKLKNRSNTDKTTKKYKNAKGTLLKKRQNAWMGNLNTSTKKQQNSKEKQKATKRHQNMVLNNCTQENVKKAAKVDEVFFI